MPSWIGPWELVLGLGGIGGIVALVFYLLALQHALEKCSPQNRTMTPGLVWLQVIPVFGLVWQFFVVIALGKSLGNEYRSRGIPAASRPGQSFGLTMASAWAAAAVLGTGFSGLLSAFSHGMNDLGVAFLVAGGLVSVTQALVLAALALFIAYSMGIRSLSARLADPRGWTGAPSAGPPAWRGRFCWNCGGWVPGDPYCRRCGVPQGPAGPLLRGPESREAPVTSVPETVGGRTGSNAAGWRRLQSVVLILLLVLLAGLLASGLVLSIISDRMPVWTLTRPAMAALLLLLVPLYGLASWMLLSSTRPVMAGLVLVFSLYGLLEPPGELNFVIRGAGMAAIALSLIFGFRTGRRPRSPRHPGAIVAGVAVGIGAFFLLLGLFAWGLGAEEEFVHERSPDGYWLVSGTEYNPGAMGGFTQTVTLTHEGNLFLRRVRGVYSGDGGRPTVSWLDNRTLLVKGIHFDIFADPAISDYH